MISSKHVGAWLLAACLLVGATRVSMAHCEDNKKTTNAPSCCSKNKTAMSMTAQQRLGVAYRDTMVTFARALEQESKSPNGIDVTFARTAATEIRRAAAGLQQCHSVMSQTAEGKAMDECCKDVHFKSIDTTLGLLDQELANDKPDATKIGGYATALQQCCKSNT